MKHHFVGIATIGALALGILSGCSAYDSFADYISRERSNNCPNAEVLAAASVLPAFDPKLGADSTTIVYTAKLTQVEMSCITRKKLNKATSDLTLHFRVTRATGGPEATYKLPYFIAATINGRILDKEVHWQEFHFAEGQAAVDFDASVEDLVTQASRRRRPSDYHFVVGFQLTKAQLDYVKQAELYAQ